MLFKSPWLYIQMINGHFRNLNWRYPPCVMHIFEACGIILVTFLMLWPWETPADFICNKNNPKIGTGEESCWFYILLWNFKILHAIDAPSNRLGVHFYYHFVLLLGQCLFTSSDLGTVWDLYLYAQILMAWVLYLIQWRCLSTCIHVCMYEHTYIIIYIYIYM